MPRLSFRVMRKPEGGNLPKGFPFWIGTIVGSFFVVFVFIIAIIDINQASRSHSRTLDFLNLSGFQSRVSRPMAPAHDLAAPQLSLVSPIPGQVLSGSVPVKVSAADRYGEVASVKLFIDGQDKGELAAPYEFSWNTISVKNGAHTLRVVATDKAGNEAAVSEKVTVEN